ncbi:CopG/Arc/MetJ family addiction module antidote protein [Agrobacterium albertimagni AOL15]|uniref:CopG/Arc/MetJ family addiction module antidote protein n=1 Tax=Agrobacterium albertimagni AOL15 TaxID=1156935 RepID=K2Q4I1_9HYPH|nr:hypothetical protein [Agrobacterium albertimagni]EKF60095.1 CopG/Arc/MetJ family addiction module antidote protein [Agrobacterium albertimagni AOL15]
MSENAAVALPLSKQTVERIDAAVRTGRFDSREAAILEGLDALSQRDEDLEQWLHRDVIPTIEEMRKAPESSVHSGNARQLLHGHLSEQLSRRSE